MSGEEEPYWIGRNPTEQQRLNRQHFIWTKCISYLIHPSIKSNLSQDAKIADIGTGTGIWLNEVSKVSPPTYTFTGFDNSSAQFLSPEELSPNVKLQIGDFMKPFPEELHGTFDLVNIRLIVVTMTGGRGVWERTLKNVLTLLKPGGFIQWIEGNFFGSRGYRKSGGLTPYSSSLTQGQLQMNNTFIRRFDWNFPASWTQLYTSAGLTHVFEDLVSTDRVPEQRREITELGIGAVFGALSNLAATAKAKEMEGKDGTWPEEEVQRVRGLAVQEMEAGVYYRWDIHVTVGRKPAVDNGVAQKGDTKE
ncbi:hypothetical protein GQ43DRAFT_408126 [Delitschia confertaspora ATCC 74209]|uniref:Methyltransferase domain-containing protein n=1 Tax=Delitschia confertaspora ATCC 74209 TaxID=1513339 RepID=A0A9P4JVC1_9PLEO|nr:hypothetical protein GQ43DRAFT_408126 [Delitschia confertaspora ATCC 74209]